MTHACTFIAISERCFGEGGFWQDGTVCGIVLLRVAVSLGQVGGLVTARWCAGDVPALFSGDHALGPYDMEQASTNN